MIQMMIATTITTAITPTTAPALKMPAIAEQLLSKLTIIKMAAVVILFFIFVTLTF
jgi:hypothetical protein